MWAIAFAALCAVPAAVFQAGVGRFTRRTGSSPGRAPTAPPENDAHERYRRDLRRLAADHDRVLVADVPAKAARLRALELAYDDTLVHACRALEVDAPPAPFDAITRVQVEADLVTHGLTW
ncbi:MAG: hypothetical protein ABR571_05035 [Jatrophihabitans sp.]|uniref:hypothetical protein n=1 Tax=Jatrophihabitans sp. TaxID=1932789 RepID=UPI0039140E90